MNKVFIGRQPIYDRQLNVMAYELLFRDSECNAARIDNPDKATSELIVNALTELGLTNIVEDKLAFINLTRNFITGNMPLPGSEETLVLEVLEDIPLDADVLNGIQKLKRRGYTIALDDFIFHPHLEPLVQVADIVKLDLFRLKESELSEHVRKLKRYPIRLLAEKVETQEVYERCMALGFDYFQGYFFCKPNVISGHRTPANRMALLHLLAKLAEADTKMHTLENLIAQDVTLSFRLLRYINSSKYMVDKNIDSVKHAVMLLGMETVRSLAYLIIISSSEDKPFELFVTALIRAHMCELLATETGDRSMAPTYFTVGLFSVIDAIMDKPMHEVLEQLPLSDDICLALLEKKGRMGNALRCTIDYERGNWEALEFSGLPSDTIRDIYIKALKWCRNFTESLDSLNAA